MKINIKSFISGFLMSTVLITLSSIVLAENIFIQTFDNIKVRINGEQISTDVKPFIYNGRTFVPIRVISEKLNKNVNWDGTNYIVDVNDKLDDKMFNITMYENKQYIQVLYANNFLQNYNYVLRLSKNNSDNNKLLSLTSNTNSENVFIDNIPVKIINGRSHIIYEYFLNEVVKSIIQK
jgi:hypothetical protein